MNAETGTVKSFMKSYENEVKAVDRLTITGDDYGLRAESFQSSIVIVARNRVPIESPQGGAEDAAKVST